MKIFLAILFFSGAVLADNDIELKIDWVQNVAKSSVLEVCGKANSKSGKWPLLISVTHGESVFSTLTSKDHRFCLLLARQTWDGKVTADASSMDQKSTSTQTLNLK
ncbi:MAG: hypothetical protein BroJett040_08190 [Oligoflexia bacterium]|nr:MAG: hypothetical protein BroJett040_08190 [Oligoflexia bacterium]